MKISLEIMMLAPFLVITITGSKKALVSSRAGLEERQESHLTSMMCERRKSTCLKIQQYPKGIKVQVMLSQSTESVSSAGHPDPSGKQGCTLPLLNLSICWFMETPQLVTGDRRKGLQVPRKGISKSCQPSQTLHSLDKLKLRCRNK